MFPETSLFLGGQENTSRIQLTTMVDMPRGSCRLDTNIFFRASKEHVDRHKEALAQDRLYTAHRDAARSRGQQHLPDHGFKATTHEIALRVS